MAATLSKKKTLPDAAAERARRAAAANELAKLLENEMVDDVAACDADLVRSSLGISDVCEAVDEPVTLAPAKVDEILSVLLRRAAHKNPEVAAAAAAAVASLAPMNVKECLLSHPLSENLLRLLNPFLPSCTYTSKSHYFVLTTIYLLLTGTGGDTTTTKQKVTQALIAKGLLGAVTTFLAYQVVVEAPHAAAARRCGSASAVQGIDQNSSLRLPPGAPTACGPIDTTVQLLHVLSNLLEASSFPLSMATRLLPILEQLMTFPDDDRAIVTLACTSATHLASQSPQHRSACEAAGVTARVVALIKQATAAFLRAGSSSGGDLSAWQPPFYVVAALKYLQVFAPVEDPNVLRTVLMLLASLRRLPSEAADRTAASESALHFLAVHAKRGRPEQRRLLIDGGILNTLLDVLANPTGCDFANYLVAPVIIANLLNGDDSPRVAERLLRAADAYTKCDGLSLPLYHFVRGFAGFPKELKGVPSQELALAESTYKSSTAMGMALLMQFGAIDGSSSSGCGRACDDASSWWHQMVRHLREVMKTTRHEKATAVLHFCESIIENSARRTKPAIPPGKRRR